MPNRLPAHIRLVRCHEDMSRLLHTPGAITDSDDRMRVAKALDLINITATALATEESAR